MIELKIIPPPEPTEICTLVITCEGGGNPIIVPLPGYVSVDDLRSGKAKIVVYGGGGEQ